MNPKQIRRIMFILFPFYVPPLPFFVTPTQLKLVVIQNEQPGEN